MSTVITANVAIAAALITWTNGKAQQDIELRKLALENQKFVFSQIEKAVQGGNPSDVRKNLVLLIDPGLLSDPDGILRRQLARAEEIPTLPQSK